MLAMTLMGCKTKYITEQQRFERSVLKELPFSVDSVSWLASGDLPTFSFFNAEYVHASPDAEIRPDGDYWICNMFDAEPLTHQKEENIWRNVLVSRKNQRVVCIDRYLQQGRTRGHTCPIKIVNNCLFLFIKQRVLPVFHIRRILKMFFLLIFVAISKCHTYEADSLHFQTADIFLGQGLFRDAGQEI